MSSLSVRELSYAYPDGRVALAEVSLEIASGERVALVGPNGAGKSTLLLHLNGLLPERIPHANAAHKANGLATIHIGETPLVAATLAAVRRRVGLVFQDPLDQLFGATVAEDVALGPLYQGLAPREVDARIAAALAAVGLSGYESRLPRKLSLGERKRVSIAGVLACQPEIILLDEPTANLDPRSRRELLSLLAALPCTLLVAGHDLEAILELCPRVVVLSAGRLVADGPSPSILADAALMDAHGLEVPVSLRSEFGSGERK